MKKFVLEDGTVAKEYRDLLGRKVIQYDDVRITFGRLFHLLGERGWKMQKLYRGRWRYITSYHLEILQRCKPLHPSSEMGTI